MSVAPRFDRFSRHRADFGPFCRFCGLTGLFPMSSQGLTGDGHAIFRSLPTRKMGLNLGAQKLRDDHENVNGYAVGGGATIPIARPPDARYPARLMLVVAMNGPIHRLVTKRQVGHAD